MPKIRTIIKRNGFTPDPVMFDRIMVTVLSLCMAISGETGHSRPMMIIGTILFSLMVLVTINDFEIIYMRNQKKNLIASLKYLPEITAQEYRILKVSDIPMTLYIVMDELDSYVDGFGDLSYLSDTETDHYYQLDDPDDECLVRLML